MQIKDVARETGLSVHTIRYYEKEGLLDSRFVCRDANNYRRYDKLVIEHLKIIKFGQSAGFTLAEIKYLTQDEIFNQITSKEAFDLLEKKRGEIEVKIGELKQVKALLTHKIKLVQHDAVQTNKKEA